MVERTVALLAWTLEEGKRYYWVPRRTFDTDRGKITKHDVLVSGYLDGAQDQLARLKELARDQAGMSGEEIDARVRDAGSVSYHTLTTKGKSLSTAHPHLHHVYDTQLENGQQTAHLVERDDVELMSVYDLWMHLFHGRFPQHAEALYLDCLFRHGSFDEDAGCNVQELSRRLHRKIEFI